MTQIVLVHGIAKQVKGPESLLADLYPALADGMDLAGGTIDRDAVSMAFYGDLFRKPGRRDHGIPELDASDVTDPIEEELLMAWWQAAADAESAVVDPAAPGRVRTPYPVQRALDALSHSTFFAGIGERLLIFSARQVRRYMTEPEIRSAAQRRLASCVTDETHVIVAHSLGSVVAYETLCAHPEWSNIGLVTLGSPLGVRNLIFDRLTPQGDWPKPVTSWTNIADRGDVVALAKTLSPLFGERVLDVAVHNGANAHDARPYLTAKETGEAILKCLA